MKKVIKILGSIVLIILILTGAALAFDNEPEGFRGLKWGDPPAKDMIAFTAGPLVNHYTLPDESLSLGNADLYRIVYQFSVRPEGEVFMSVGLLFRGEKNYKLLKIICRGKFGEEEEKSYQGDIVWGSPKSVIMLHYDTIEEAGYLAISSQPIVRESREAVEKLEIEKAKKDW